MSDMTPQEAQGIMSRFVGMDAWEMEAQLARALRTITTMAEEVDYRIVDPDTNGGNTKCAGG